MSDTVGAPSSVLEPGRRAGDQDALGVVEHELVLLIRRSRAVAREVSQEIEPWLDSGAFSLLARLEEAGPSRPSDLAAYFGVGKPTVGRQLTCLEDAGLAVRHPDPDDGRAHRLDLTPEGRQQVHAQRAARQRVLRSRFGELSDDELAEVARALRVLNDVLA